MSFQCANAVQHPEIPHERVAVAHTACSACTVRGVDHIEGLPSEHFLAATMAVTPLNGYHDTELDPDAPFAIGRVLSLPAAVEAAPMLPSAHELSLMSFAE